ncbi:DUF2267 domain-containing protein [Streptomyces sp. MST-110588]|uniref:DUF2267 domain-containing protein n=1 Tax=Streptomyces sp. MST-110588 TaxID=2833628 RepID=UPI001F5C452E|nr:DUF2267 domain-containing protein [Streptomyces sp. MST-110588]UNO42017.1 DUF2267 domain-containing protein [Streptomyces sp. MST-110588]
MRYDELVKAVKKEGRYPTERMTERVVHDVLAALGRQLVGDERVELARLLPDEAAVAFVSQIPSPQPLTAGEFTRALAEASGVDGATEATARWDAGSVLTVLTRHIDPGLLRRILHQLPEGYALLFGQARLAPAA